MELILTLLLWGLIIVVLPVSIILGLIVMFFTKLLFKKTEYENRI